MGFQYDVVVVGIGHIGLPLLLSWAAQGKKAIGFDHDEKIVASLQKGRMPFEEPGAQNLLDSSLKHDSVTFTTQAKCIANARDIVLTIGSVPLSAGRRNGTDVISVIMDMLPLLREEQHLVLRGTLAPGTTEYIASLVERDTNLKIGHTFFLTHCPERIAEGHFFEEIETIPQIIGSPDQGSADRARQLFANFASKKLVTTPLQAELAKIWSNVLRYAAFALPNLLLLNCEQYGANVFEVIDLLNEDYMRGGIAQPGLTAGACLRKDFSFVEDDFIGGSTMLTSIWRLHESMPAFLIEGAKKRLGSLKDRKVAVLGLTFKAESDDMRDSLSEPLIHYLQRELVDLQTHDPFVPSASLDEALAEAELVIIATNHETYGSEAFRSMFYRLTHQGVLLVDIWNIMKTNHVFSFPKTTHD